MNTKVKGRQSTLSSTTDDDGMHPSGHVIVEGDPNKIDLEKLGKIIERLAFQGELDWLTLD